MYSATKAFLSKFLESLRADLRSVGVAVTDVRPGFVNTPMTDAASGPHPFLVERDRAAKIIVRGIVKRRAVVAFPWQLAAISRCGLLLPAPLYDRIVNAAREQQRSAAEQGEIMKALVLTAHGAPDVLKVREQPEPVVGRGQIRVAVRAAGVNFADIMARQGLYPDAPKPPAILGYEVAGTVESVGEGVTSLESRRPRHRRDTVWRVRGARGGGPERCARFA